MTPQNWMLNGKKPLPVISIFCSNQGETRTEATSGQRTGLCGTIRKRMRAVNLEGKLKLFSDYWSPKVVSRYNGNEVMLVKVKGEFQWHSHPDTDDFFLVLKGTLVIRLREGDVTVGPGELYVVPAGVEHCPVAAEEVHLLLIEPAGTPNTGDPETAAPKGAI